MLSDLRIRFRSLFRRGRVEQELDDELRFHMEQQAGKYLRAGLSKEEAQRRVRLEFGGAEQVKEDCRDARGVSFLESLGHDLRYALRMLRKSPVFTAVVIITLALGIGANTAIFTLVNAVMLRSLPVHDPQQLVVAQWTAHHAGRHLGESSFGDCGSGPDSGTTVSGCALSYSFFQEIQNQKSVFSSVTAFAGTIPLNLSGNGTAVIAQGEIVSGSFFHTFGVNAALGRVFDSSDDQPGSHAVAVLNYAYWQRAFGGSPSAIGRTIRLNNLIFTIIGVADPGFTRLTPGKSVDLWIPIAQGSASGQPWVNTSDANNFWLVVVGRLLPGVSRAQAQSLLDTLFVNASTQGAKPIWIAADQPQLALLPAQEGLAGIRDMFGKPLLLLMATVGLVLLVACANVAGLTLARAAAREREMAVRLAVGAARRRILRQLLTESLLLSFLGAAFGVVLAWFGASGVEAFLSASSGMPIQLDVHLDWHVLLFGVAAAILTGIAFGLAPAFRGARTGVTAQLKGTTITAAAGRGRGRRFGLGSGLVVLQVAISMVVLTGAGLLLRTLDKLRSIDPGFDTRNLLLFTIDPELAGYKDAQILDLYGNVQKKIAALPGVTHVSYSSLALLDGGLWSGDMNLEGRADKHPFGVQMLSVGPDYFATMKIPLLQGRTLIASDAKGPKAAVVNHAFVEKFMAGRSPLGLHFGNGDSKPDTEIVGVVGDTHYADLSSPEAPTCFLLLNGGGATFEVRTAVAPSSLVAAVRDAVNGIDANIPVMYLRTQSDSIDRLLFSQRLLAQLFGIFGVLGLLLACIGLYGLLSYEVERRTREIGIRTALGAQRSAIWSMVVFHGIVLVAVGAFVGWGAAFGVTRLLTSMLYNVRPTDPLTFGLTAGLLLAVGILACSLPARRATRVDPMTALRCE
ncbi:MAG TPA: ABC transporter permease [Acidobacteriaceae bacterium]|nr:ABC transporter permease [Acidobacteriaceae bacterium]